MSELSKLNLASLLENPEKLKEIFSNKSRGEFATESLRILAGSEASMVVDNLIKNINAKVIDSKNIITNNIFM